MSDNFNYLIFIIRTHLTVSASFPFGVIGSDSKLLGDFLMN